MLLLYRDWNAMGGRHISQRRLLRNLISGYEFSVVQKEIRAFE